MERYGSAPFSQPIPKGRRFKQIFMLRDLADVHANGSGDLFEMGLIVRGHRRELSRTARATESGEARGAAQYHDCWAQSKVALSREVYSSPVGRIVGSNPTPSATN